MITSSSREESRIIIPRKKRINAIRIARLARGEKAPIAGSPSGDSRKTIPKST